MANISLAQIFSIISLNIYFKKKISTLQSISFIDKTFNYFVLAFTGNILIGKMLNYSSNNYLNCIDLASEQKIIFLSNTNLLVAHALIFFIFHFLPAFPRNTIHQAADLIRCLFDSFLKSKLMLNTIKNASFSGNNNFFEVFFILICSTQLNKYIFERFLINSRDSNSMYRNISNSFCFMIFSTNWIPLEILKPDGTIFGATLILFMGYYMDNWHCAKTKLRLNKQGQFKLQRNAKA